MSEDAGNSPSAEFAAGMATATAATAAETAAEAEQGADQAKETAETAVAVAVNADANAAEARETAGDVHARLSGFGDQLAELRSLVEGLAQPEPAQPETIIPPPERKETPAGASGQEKDKPRSYGSKGWFGS